jgi:uncharacterized protein (UPF0332 family)
MLDERRRMITEDRFLEYAKKIMSQHRILEEESRTAISRAYYSLYHVTGSVLQKKYSLQLIKEIQKMYSKRRIDQRRLNRLDRQYLRSFNLHRIFYLTLMDLGHTTIAFQFKNFRSKRNDADYDLNLNFREGPSRIIVSQIDNLTSKVSNL